MVCEEFQRGTVDLANSLAGQGKVFADLCTVVTFEVNREEDLSGPFIQNASSQVAQLESALYLLVIRLGVTPVASEYLKGRGLAPIAWAFPVGITGHQAQSPPMFSAAKALLGSPECAHSLVVGDNDCQGLPWTHQAVRRVPEKGLKSFGEYIVCTDRGSVQAPLCPGHPARTRVLQEEGFVDLGVHHVGDYIEALPVSLQRMRGVECR